MASYVVPNPAFAREWMASPFAARLLGATTGVVAGRAQQIAPEETGEYRDSIHATIQKVAGIWVGRVVANVRYAGYLEIGTEDTPAFHTLTTAAESVGLRVGARE